MRPKTFAICVLAVGPVCLGGDVTDPSGDGVSEDIECIQGRYDSSELEVRVNFYSGTYNLGSSGALIGIDADMNTSTGAGPGFPFGAEYSVLYNPLNDLLSARLFQLDTGSVTEIGTVDAVPSGSGIRVMIPLGMIGGNGLVNYGVLAGPAINADFLNESDYAPDDVIANGMTATSVAVCEPDFAPPEGVLDFNDIVDFLTLFSTMDSAADFAAPEGVFDFNDVVAFLTLFAAGCP
ncbi:MAG: GC-type dockerin domain-anchored protein [Phycisphaerales bacterium JB059]